MSQSALPSRSEIPEFETLEEAKKYLFEHWEKGARCPACTQQVKLYSRAMHYTMARMLIELYKLDRNHPGEYFHVVKIGENISSSITNAGDFAKLRYWGLITAKENTDDAKRTSGLWAITLKGKAFAKNQLRVPARIKLYDSRFYGYDGDEVAALGR